MPWPWPCPCPVPAPCPGLAPAPTLPPPPCPGSALTPCPHPCVLFCLCPCPCMSPRTCAVAEGMVAEEPWAPERTVPHRQSVVYPVVPTSWAFHCHFPAVKISTQNRGTRLAFRGQRAWVSACQNQATACREAAGLSQMVRAQVLGGQPVFPARPRADQCYSARGFSGQLRWTPSAAGLLRAFNGVNAQGDSGEIV